MLTQKCLPNSGKLGRRNSNHDDKQTRGKPGLGNAVQCVKPALLHVAALVTESVSVMLLAVGFVLTRLEFWLTIPSIDEALDAVARPITHAVVEEVVARDIEFYCRAVGIE